TAKKLSAFRFEGSLHQQLSAEPGHLLQDLRQRPVIGEQLIDVVADTVSRRYSDRHGRGSFLRRLAGLEGNLRPLLIYTGSWTPPPLDGHQSSGFSPAGCPTTESMGTNPGRRRLFAPRVQARDR